MNPLAGYAACKSAVVTHTNDGSQTNYQMKLTIVKGDGVDAAGTTYLDNKALNWPYDIRFTKVDGTTLLDFWREEYDATDGTWWIEVDSIPDPDNATIYLHVGDADAIDDSNGSNTFLFFDHFDGDLSKWTGDTAAATIASSICTLTGSAGVSKALTSANAYSNNIALRARCLLNGTAYSKLLITDADETDEILSYSNGGSRVDYATYKTTGTAIGFANDAGSYHIFDFIRLISGTDTSTVLVDGASRGSTTSNVPIVDLSARMATYNATTQKTDWILIRNITYNEPTWGAWGSWEGGATLIRSVPRIARIMVMSP